MLPGMPKNRFKAFRIWLKKTREDRGLSQLEAARALKLAGCTVSRWEAGSEPRGSHVGRLARWGGISVEDLAKMLEAA